MTERADLLMDVIQAKRNLADSYQKLSDAVYEFEEKYCEKGIILTANVNWKSKTDLWIVFRDELPDNIDEIVEDFKNTFNLELDEIIKETSLKTQMRSSEWIHWKYMFHHIDTWKRFKEDK